MKILSLKDNLVYFSGPTIGENLALKVISGPLKYTSLLVYFSGPTIGENLGLQVISGPLMYTSLIHYCTFVHSAKGIWSAH